MSDYVRHEFSPPRHCEEYRKSWKLTADGESVVFLPQSTTTLERNDEDLVVAATVPRYVAEERGFVVDDGHSESQPRETAVPDTMSREDWYVLFLTCALLVRGDQPRNAEWEAKKIAAKLLRGDAGE